MTIAAPTHCIATGESLTSSRGSLSDRDAIERRSRGPTIIRRRRAARRPLIDGLPSKSPVRRNQMRCGARGQQSDAIAMQVGRRRDRHCGRHPHRAAPRIVIAWAFDAAPQTNSGSRGPGPQPPQGHPPASRRPARVIAPITPTPTRHTQQAFRASLADAPYCLTFLENRR